MSEIEKKGHLHPLTQVIWEVCQAFREMGFEVAEGPEVEDEFHNFDALNIPANHPSRDMQDTFWVKGGKNVLRTQTSAVQVRYMEEMLKQGKQPPFSIIAPGKVFRNEATDARHEAQFHQIECLLVGQDISVAHLKGYLTELFAKLYGKETEVRLRPSFFPFVEPAFETDTPCLKCTKDGKAVKGNQCSLCSGSGWMEMGGSGMVHPNVLKAVNLDPEIWRGFAFGFGVDRLAMLKFGVDDIRTFYEGDLRLMKQF
ncbi:MAG: phenylalanine--tRNA ligase subunit alpha [Candidatus Vogelbacteria bacterium]|nr:phenylalanine--tRNA ligase subunit alpha [Candidatus Vogelbacteria bacterium]